MGLLEGTIGLLALVFIFLFGTVVGSFLNVCALRYNTGRSLEGRSACPSCTRVLNWFELVPVFSFIFLRGHCRTCRSPLSIQYPLTELLTGLLFVGLFLKSISIVGLIYGAVFVCIYLVIGIYDIRHTIVPDGLSYTVALLAFLGLFVADGAIAIEIPTLLELSAGPLVAFPLFLLWFISRGTWMGLGDAKLALSIGWLLGLLGGFASLLIAFWTGAIVGVLMLLFSHLNRYATVSRAGKSRLSRLRGHRTMKSEIAFAPFLLLGLAVVFFFDIDILQLLIWQW